MGGRIAGRIIEAGHTVVGLDIDPERAAAIGATPAASVADVARRADVVLLSLPDSRAVETVALGGDGLVAHGREGQIVVDLSTAAPASTRRLHAAFAERGVRLLDAGISGGAKAAELGTLTLMVGGAPEALDELGWLLECFSEHVVHMGESGSGHTAKLLNNFLNGVSLAATAEVMVAARKAGLDLEAFINVLNVSSGMNFATVNRFPHMIHGDYLEGGLTSRLMTKDLVLYVELLHELGVPTINASGPLASFGLATNLGYDDQISNRVVDAIGDVAGGVRLHEPLPAEGRA